MSGASLTGSLRKASCAFWSLGLAVLAVDFLLGRQTVPGAREILPAL
jgi:hypothetical protein